MRNGRNIIARFSSFPMNLESECTMKKITIENPDYSIEINGSVFDVQIDEYESLAKAEEFAKKYEDISKLRTADEITGAKAELTEFVEKIIGAGAVKKIMGGKEPKLAFLIKLMQELNKYFGEVTADYMAKEYGE